MQVQYVKEAGMLNAFSSLLGGFGKVAGKWGSDSGGGSLFS